MKLGIMQGVRRNRMGFAGFWMQAGLREKHVNCTIGARGNRWRADPSRRRAAESRLTLGSIDRGLAKIATGPESLTDVSPGLMTRYPTVTSAPSGLIPMAGARPPSKGRSVKADAEIQA
jgi:hypothetical protein